MKIEHNEIEVRSAGATQGESLPRLVSLVFFALSILLLAGLAARVIYGLGTQAAMFNHPFQLDESEGMIVAETMLLDRGVGIFGQVTPDLFIAAPYPPLFYLLSLPAQHLLGAEPSFKIGRAISLVSMLVAGIAIYGIALSLTRSKLGSAVGMLAFWSLGLVTFWGSLVKPDMLALMLGLVGLWWLVARPAELWWALPFFIGAFYTKQTAIAAAVAAIVWLITSKPRKGLLFGVAYGVSVVVPSMLLNWATAGGYLYHMFTIHSLPWFPDRFTGFLLDLAIDYGALLLPGLFAICGLAVAWLYRRVKRQDRATLFDGGLLLGVYFVLSLVVASGTGTLGGSHNHLLDLSAALCLGLGVSAGVLFRTGDWRWQAIGVAPALLALAWVPCLFSVPVWLQIEFNQLKPEPTAGMMNIFQYVTNNGGEAYSDNIGLLVSTHKRLWSTDPFTQTHATFYKRWDQSKLLAAIAARRFAQVILRVDVNEPEAGAGDVSPEILQAVRDNYKLDQRNVLNIYVPR